MTETGGTNNPEASLDIEIADEETGLPPWAERPALVRFLHEDMKPYEDRVEDIERALDYVFSKEPGMGGRIILGAWEGALVGAVVMLRTGMKGYIPENVLLFVGVSPSMRGKGIGGILIRRAIDAVEGDVKLHVEYENPAKRLYERIGFTTKYAEMRFQK